MVEFVDGVVGRRHEERCPAGFSFHPPAGDGGGADVVLGAAVEAVVVVVELCDVGVATAESEAGVAFPVVVEAVDPVEFDGVVGVDEEAEHATSTDGGELHRVADEDDSPALSIGQLCEFGELLGGGHAGFVDDERRSRRQVVAMVRRPLGGVFDEELVERVGHDAGLLLQHLGRTGGRRDPEHSSTVGAQLGDDGAEGGGLAGAGGPDDEDELLVASDP